MFEKVRDNFGSTNGFRGVENWFWFSIFGFESVRCVTIVLSSQGSKTHSVQGTGSLITLQELQ